MSKMRIFSELLSEIPIICERSHFLCAAKHLEHGNFSSPPIRVYLVREMRASNNLSVFRFTFLLENCVPLL